MTPLNVSPSYTTPCRATQSSAAGRRGPPPGDRESTASWPRGPPAGESEHLGQTGWRCSGWDENKQLVAVAAVGFFHNKYIMDGDVFEFGIVESLSRFFVQNTARDLFWSNIFQHILPRRSEPSSEQSSRISADSLIKELLWQSRTWNVQRDAIFTVHPPDSQNKNGQFLQEICWAVQMSSIHTFS